MNKILKVDENEIKHLQAIEYIEKKVYLIKLKAKNGEKLDSIARITEDSIDSNANRRINFDSEDIGKQVMQGFIYIKPICEAIYAFYKANNH